MWLRLLASVVVLTVSSASSASEEQFRLGPVYTDRPGEVSAVLEVAWPPGSLSASDFRLVADDETVVTAQKITSFKESGRGLALIICVDVSKSMSGEPLRETREVLYSFLIKENIRPQDRVALVSFADDDKIEFPFKDTPTGPKELQGLQEAVSKLKPRGKQTKLFQALYKALDMLEGAKVPERRRLLVISDGKDEGSDQSLENVVDKATTSSVIPIDVIGRGKIDSRFADVLKYLTTSTHGSFVNAVPGQRTVQQAIDWIFSNILENLALVVYFRYEIDPAGSKTSDASLAFRRLGEEHPSWSGRIAEEIPRPKGTIIVPPPWPPPWLSWLLLAVILALVLALWSRRRGQRVEETGQPKPRRPVTLPEQEMPVSPQDSGTPILSPDLARSSGRRREATVVGRSIFPMPEQEKPIAILKAVSGPLQGKQFSVEKHLFHIGVGQENDLRIATDDSVSVSHAFLRYEKGILIIFDNGSRTGTVVNKNQVPATGIVLNLGDRISIGMSTFEVGLLKKTD